MCDYTRQRQSHCVFDRKDLAPWTSFKSFNFMPCEAIFYFLQNAPPKIVISPKISSTQRPYSQIMLFFIIQIILNQVTKYTKGVRQQIFGIEPQARNFGELKPYTWKVSFLHNYNFKILFLVFKENSWTSNLDPAEREMEISRWIVHFIRFGTIPSP
jgi:hypothetical protein